MSADKPFDIYTQATGMPASLKGVRIVSLTLEADGVNVATIEYQAFPNVGTSGIVSVAGTYARNWAGLLVGDATSAIAIGNLGSGHWELVTATP